MIKNIIDNKSGDTCDAANVVFGLISPVRYEFNEYRGYNINPNSGGLGDRFKGLKVLKSRDGIADISIGLGFLGEIGKFVELPKAEDMTTEAYNRILNIKKYAN